ncbi:polymorphic toxin type 15 domain-containing protein [Actinomyces sp.]|uniref:polymorphic toxin type 15 domain-containing protein n=1 Tax=Actinomyces sp. TaxID=29317 RepID=UPI0026DAA0D7|nr:polymorphic toxin type 15 domain-containing protein [Actinomyces sp.]
MFFHTGRSPGLRALSGEFTRQLDRQLSALSLLSAQRLLDGIRAYRTQGRAPTSSAVKDARQNFMTAVTKELTRNHGFSESRAREAVGLVDQALVVLHESDQVTYGPGDPVLVGGLGSMGVDRVNSSIGSQGKPVARVLEQAVLAITARATAASHNPTQAPAPRKPPGLNR